MAGGRPSKLTPQLIKRLRVGIEAGLPYKTVCELAGVSYSSFSEWVELGEQGVAEFSEFLEVIQKANARAEQILLGRVLAAAKKHRVVTKKSVTTKNEKGESETREEKTESAEWDWRAAAWMLTHAPRFKRAYAERVEQSVSVDWRAALAAQGIDPDKAADALAAAMRAGGGDAGGEGEE